MTELQESGLTVEKVTGEEAKRLTKNYFMYTDGVIRIQPGNWIFPANFQEYLKTVYNFKVKSSDIFVVALPKSGTNWIQEIVWNLVHNPDLDNPEANITIDARCPFYEIDFFFNTTGVSPVDPNGEIMKRFNQLCPGKDPSEGIFINLAEFSPYPRLIKSHLSFNLLPPDVFQKSKIIYLARDPRDAMVSFYHFSKHHEVIGFRGTLEEYVDDYINDRSAYQPYWEHVKLAWEKRNDPNLLIVFYEDLKADPQSEIKRIDEFIETNRDDKQIDNIVRYTEFSNMKEKTKNNPPTSIDNMYIHDVSQKEEASYYRKGKVGSWKEDLSPELTSKVNSWMKKNLSNFGDDFKYKVFV